VPELRVCPSCGAYVITERNNCPRCDAPLDEPDAPDKPAQPPATETGRPTTDVLPASEAAPPADDEPPAGPPRPWLPQVDSVPETAGEGVEPAPGEDEPPLERPAARPTMPGWLPEETLPAVDAGHAPEEARPAPEPPPVEAEVTLARLPENIEDELGSSPNESPTLQFDRRLDAGPSGEADITSPSLGLAPVPAPPASALRPPLQGWMPYPYGGAQNYWDAATRFYQQRVQAYLDAGYRAHIHSAHEATLSLGKQLGALGWVLALVTGIGALWYVLILTLSGFRPDVVYLTLEADGRVYEDGPGAAHVRRERARSGRRWSLIGLTILVLSLVLALVLGTIVGLALRDDQRRAAVSQIDLLGVPLANLFEAFNAAPAVTASQAQIAQAENAAIVVSLLGGLALVGIWGGATLLVIGTVHALAYRTRVPPLPGYA